MLKLTFIIDSLISGGAERVMSIVANKFTECGYYTTIISKTHEPPFYKLDSNVKLVYLRTKVDHRNRVTILFSRLKLYVDIYNYLKTTKPDVVVSFMTNTNGVTIIVCKLLGLKVIASEHNNYKLKLNTFPVWFIKRVIYPRAMILTVLTERDKKDYYGRFMNNVIVMPNPLALEPVTDISLLKRDKIILSVGELIRVDQKGFDLLLEVFAQISPVYPDWKLIIAGSGDPGYINLMVKKLGLEDKVSLVGEVNDIQALMRMSSIFTMTSRWEGLPMALLEAMSQGMACISFDCYTGPRELITNRWDGILIEDQNSEDFVAGLKELIADIDLRNNLGMNAIETSKKYLPGEIMNKWHRIIEDLQNPDE